MTENFDIIIIGAGPGGYRAAELAAKAGKKVAIFDDGDVGGTCLNVGCIPTKCYVHSATFEEARERMAQVVAQLRSGVEHILSHPNITLIRAHAAFVDAHTVCAQSSPQPAGTADGAPAEGTGDTFTAPHIIIATGSETKYIPVEDLDDARVVDSTGLLQLSVLPRRLCIIGAGVIGMEFASVFNRFGSEVTVIEYLKECLPALDSDIAKRLRKCMEKQGITFRMKTAVKRLADIDADVILMATGRKPRTVGLHPEAAGITLAPNGAIPVNDNLQVISLTSHPSPLTSIYAIGDVNGRQMLAHAAEAQAKEVVEHIVNSAEAVANTPLTSSLTPLTSHLSPLTIMPAAIFTSPEAASVGMSEDQLKAEGVAYECRKAFHRANGKALAMNETEGMLKLFSEPGAGRILGCHAFGAHSADLVQEASVLMCCGATVAHLRHMVHIHPTLSELLLAAAES